MSPFCSSCTSLQALPFLSHLIFPYHTHSREYTYNKLVSRTINFVMSTLRLLPRLVAIESGVRFITLPRLVCNRSLGVYLHSNVHVPRVSSQLFHQTAMLGSSIDDRVRKIIAEQLAVKSEEVRGSSLCSFVDKSSRMTGRLQLAIISLTSGSSRSPTARVSSRISAQTVSTPPSL